jgi:hypothetical protein
MKVIQPESIRRKHVKFGKVDIKLVLQFVLYSSWLTKLQRITFLTYMKASFVFCGVMEQHIVKISNETTKSKKLKETFEELKR